MQEKRCCGEARHEHAVHMQENNIRYLGRARGRRDWIVGPLVHHLAAFTIATWQDLNVGTPPRCWEVGHDNDRRFIITHHLPFFCARIPSLQGLIDTAGTDCEF
jgi:hypothetical protein